VDDDDDENAWVARTGGWLGGGYHTLLYAARARWEESVIIVCTNLRNREKENRELRTPDTRRDRRGER
jgi:hypothetical protein